MMRQVVNINWRYIGDAVPAFVTLMFIPFSYSAAYGLIACVWLRCVLLADGVQRSDDLYCAERPGVSHQAALLWKDSVRALPRSRRRSSSSPDDEDHREYWSGM